MNYYNSTLIPIDRKIILNHNIIGSVLFKVEHGRKKQRWPLIVHRPHMRSIV